MKYRLDAEAYVNNTLLPEGTIVGDEQAESWRYGPDDPNPKLRGQPRPPNASMTPLDDEAKKMFAAQYPGDTPPERDPTKKVPITPDKRDTAGHHVTQPPANPPAIQTPRTGESTSKDPSVASEKVAGPGKA